MVVDKIIGTGSGGKHAGVKAKAKIFFHQVESSYRCWPLVIGHQQLQYFVVSFQDGIDLCEEKWLMPAVCTYALSVGCIPAGIVAVFFVAPAMELFSAKLAFKGSEIGVKSTHVCKSVTYPF